MLRLCKITNVASTISSITQHLLSFKLEGRLPTSLFSHWPQHTPFSVYSSIPHTSGPSSSNIFRHEPRLTPRIHTPRPFAYSLQLYESFDRPSPPAADTPPIPEVTPQINHSSFTSYISGCSSRASTASSASTTKKAPKPHPAQEKSYAVYLHYTNKATNPRMKTQETTEFAPKGSTWDFAYTMFKKFFQKKTDLCWEQALNGSADNAVDAESRRDGGVDLSSCRQESHATGLGVEDANAIVASHQPFRYIPAHVGELAYFEKKYANRYGEDWLPTPRAVVASSQHGKLESEEMLMEGLAEVDEVEGLDQDVNNVEQFCKKIVEHKMRDGTNELVSERAEQCENGAVERGAVIVKNV